MVANARRLIGVDATAARLGLTAGLTLADARARQPTLVVCDADPQAEAKLLERAADFCARFTPLVALDGADGLMLDVSGVAHLFGDEKGLVSEVEARLSRQGLTIASGLADSPRAAWALARFSARRIAPAGLAGAGFAKLFHDMPVAALGLEAAICADLARAGLRRVGDLALRPRAPIAARFGADVIARLDALNGEERGAISPRFAPPEFSVERRFASPIETSEAVMATLARLADDLAKMLERHGKGARRLELMLFRVDGGARRIGVGAGRPQIEGHAMARLFAERLAGGMEETVDAGFGFDLLRLSCLAAERVAPVQGEWERLEDSAGARALADLIDRLSARLGSRRVTWLELIAAHLPEQAVAARAAALGAARAGQGGQMAAPAEAPARPLRLFERPEPIETLAETPDGPPLRFRWRRVLHEVTAVEGPERIAAPWWRRSDAPTRDYFRAEDGLGRRFWLYREGLYGSETTRAKWFMHGVFG
ncbi:MAG: DNA polymerase Y family protein [Bradyrhizobium sp.]|nr:MAG: DNA polymerase Y family protein [Bradyrhizobium sp.]